MLTEVEAKKMGTAVALRLARLRVTLVPAPSTLTPLIATLVLPLSTAKRAVVAPGKATGSLKRTTWAEREWLASPSCTTGELQLLHAHQHFHRPAPLSLRR